VFLDMNIQTEISFAMSIQRGLQNMYESARLALGTVQQDVDPRPLVWGLLNEIKRRDWQVQPLFTRASYQDPTAIQAIVGRTALYLDSWLMHPLACQRTLQQSSHCSDLSLVIGQYAAARPELTRQSRSEGTLDQICSWLSLPNIAVIDASKLDRCQLPTRPQNVSAVLLDKVSTPEAFFHVKTSLEALWNVPVLGGLVCGGNLRKLLDDIPAGMQPSPELLQLLGKQFSRFTNMDRIRQLALQCACDGIGSAPPTRQPAARYNIAVALDEAFHCHFGDTLDAMEAQGAKIHDFSPLHSNRIPAGVDMVYIGSGDLARHLPRLAMNYQLQHSLRQHVLNGGRLYAEGSGLAYLCHQAVLPNDRRASLCGILPAAAILKPRRTQLRPVELSVGQNTWFAKEEEKLRGYLDCMWTIRPMASVNSLASEPRHRTSLINLRNAVGSRVHFHFASQPQLLSALLHKA
jgi:cobyrinic acid a,c-diamide synthase